MQGHSPDVCPSLNSDRAVQLWNSFGNFPIEQLRHLSLSLSKKKKKKKDSNVGEVFFFSFYFFYNIFPLALNRVIALQREAAKVRGEGRSGEMGQTHTHTHTGLFFFL